MTMTIALLCVQNKVSMNLMGTLASAVLGRAYQVYYSASLAKQRIQDEMTRRLYEKTVRLDVVRELCWPVLTAALGCDHLGHDA